MTDPYRSPDDAGRIAKLEERIARVERSARAQSFGRWLVERLTSWRVAMVLVPIGLSVFGGWCVSCAEQQERRAAGVCTRMCRVLGLEYIRSTSDGCSGREPNDDSHCLCGGEGRLESIERFESAPERRRLDVIDGGNP